jgi:hypothetical protein
MIEIQKLLRAGDFFAAIERIQSVGSPKDIASRYHTLMKDFYWKAHDISAVVTLARAGIFYCLGQSMAMGFSEEAAQEMRSMAKSMAYDAGSFTWPGWQEPGINPSKEELAFGRQCAKLNLRLAIELNKPASRVSMAHWLIGAHALTARDFDLAEEEFAKAIEVLPATDAESKTLVLCNAGYLAIARLCKDSSDAEAEASFEWATSQLGAQKDEDSEQYLAQLGSVRRQLAGVG